MSLLLQPSKKCWRWTISRLTGSGTCALSGTLNKISNDKALHYCYKLRFGLQSSKTNFSATGSIIQDSTKDQQFFDDNSPWLLCCKCRHSWISHWPKLQWHVYYTLYAYNSVLLLGIQNVTFIGGCRNKDVFCRSHQWCAQTLSWLRCFQSWLIHWSSFWHYPTWING